MALLYAIIEPSLCVILQGKSKVFVFVQERVIRKSHQIYFYWLHFRELLPKTANAALVAVERQAKGNVAR